MTNTSTPSLLTVTHTEEIDPTSVDSRLQQTAQVLERKYDRDTLLVQFRTFAYDADPERGTVEESFPALFVCPPTMFHVYGPGQRSNAWGKPAQPDDNMDFYGAYLFFRTNPDTGAEFIEVYSCGADSGFHPANRIPANPDEVVDFLVSAAESCFDVWDNGGPTEGGNEPDDKPIPGFTPQTPTAEDYEGIVTGPDVGEGDHCDLPCCLDDIGESDPEEPTDDEVDTVLGDSHGPAPVASYGPRKTLLVEQVMFGLFDNDRK